MLPTRHIYALFAWGIFVLGVVHMAATARVTTSPNGAVWFFSGGIALALTGAINLLNRSYGAAAPGLRRVCIATNLGMTAFLYIAGSIGRTSVRGLVLVVGWFAATMILSSMPAALTGARENRGVPHALAPSPHA